MPRRAGRSVPLPSALAAASCTAVLIALAGCEKTGAGGTSTTASVATTSAPAPATPPGPVPQAPLATPATGERAAPAGREPVSGEVAIGFAGPPPIVFEPRVLDFGFVPPNTDVEGEVKLTNGGDAPLHILRATPTCKCTTLNPLAGVVLAPGEATTLKARLDGQEPGQRKATIQVACEGYGQTVDLDLVADISLPVRITPSIFNCAPKKLDDGSQHPGERSGAVVVESLDGRTFNVLGTDGQPPRYVGFDPEIDEPANRYMLEWDLSHYTDDEIPSWWVVETDHPACPLVAAWVRYPPNIDYPPRDKVWRVHERYFQVNLVKPGEPVEFTAEVRNMRGDTIHVVNSLSQAFDAELVGTQIKGSNLICTVKLTPRPGQRGMFVGKIEFIASRHSQRIDVIGKVTE